MWYEFSVKAPNAYFYAHCEMNMLNHSIHLRMQTGQWNQFRVSMVYGILLTLKFHLCHFQVDALCIHVFDTWCDQRHTNNIPDIWHSWVCMVLSQFSRKKNRKLFGKRNKTNEIKLDITAASAAVVVAAFSIDEKSMVFFCMCCVCDPYRCKLASNHHISHGFWNEKESETVKKKSTTTTVTAKKTTTIKQKTSEKGP